MIFTDGECPVCLDTRLHLNTDDLLECPKCGLMLSMAARFIAGIIHQRGEGKFRFENCELYPMNGVLLAKQPEGVFELPKAEDIFKDREDIDSYLGDLPNKKESIDIDFNLWFSFKKYFNENLLNKNKNDVIDFWSSRTKRTSYYQKNLMPEISKKLNLVHGKEEFKVDYVMSKHIHSEYSIPQIYIESENDFQSSNHEIRKLCSLNSPLRVLLTVYDSWIPKNSSRGDPVYNTLSSWQRIIRDHNTHNNFGFNGTIAIIIGSWIDNNLVFRSCAFWSDGDIRQPIDEFCIINL